MLMSQRPNGYLRTCSSWRARVQLRRASQPHQSMWQLRQRPISRSCVRSRLKPRICGATFAAPTRTFGVLTATTSRTAAAAGGRRTRNRGPTQCSAVIGQFLAEPTDSRLPCRLHPKMSLQLLSDRHLLRLQHLQKRCFARPAHLKHTSGVRAVTTTRSVAGAGVTSTS